MRTHIYVDGFNLYYGALRETRWRWLDLHALFTRLLPQNRIERINYYTAKVWNRPSDPTKRQRQEVYLRALTAHCPTVQIHYGQFKRWPVSMRLVEDDGDRKFARVWKTEEKGSDVNLAVHLINDAWLDRYECGVVVSNDSDLAEAMKQVARHHPDKVLGLITPRKFGTSKKLQQYATFVRSIRNGALAACQLPDPIPNTTIRPPRSWL